CRAGALATVDASCGAVAAARCEGFAVLRRAHHGWEPPSLDRSTLVDRVRRDEGCRPTCGPTLGTAPSSVNSVDNDSRRHSHPNPVTPRSAARTTRDATPTRCPELPVSCA